MPARAGRECRPPPSVIEQLKPILGPHFDKTFLRHSIERITYDSRTREVKVTLADTDCFAYTLSLGKRPGVKAQL